MKLVPLGLPGVKIADAWMTGSPDKEKHPATHKLAGLYTIVRERMNTPDFVAELAEPAPYSEKGLLIG